MIAEARTWLGTPFNHQGRIKGVACDCIGLIMGVGIALKLAVYDPHSQTARSYLSYGRSPDPVRMREGIGRWLHTIPVEQAGLADVLYMAWSREPQHVGLITDIGIIHAYARAGKVVEHRLDADWQSRIRGAWRFPVFVGGK